MIVYHQPRSFFWGPIFSINPPPSRANRPPCPYSARLRYGFNATHAEPLGTIVEGLLHAGSVTLIYGPPKAAKASLSPTSR
jgi:hypothetical protein